MKVILSFFYLFILIFACDNAYTQLSIKKTIDSIEVLRNENDSYKASLLLDQQINYFKESNLIDSLPDFVKIKGELQASLTDSSQGEEVAFQLLNYIKNQNGFNNAKVEGLESIAQYYENISNIQKAYKSTEEAIAFALKNKPLNYKQLERLEHNISIYLTSLGQIQIAKEHRKKSISYLDKIDKPEANAYYFQYNSLGVLMWYQSKIDSAAFYFEKALKDVKTNKTDLKNLYYRSGILNNNLAGAYSILGEMSKAIKAQQDATTFYKAYIDEFPAGEKIGTIKASYISSLENLAGIHKEIGNYSKALAILRKSHPLYKVYFGDNSPEVYKSHILLGQTLHALNETNQAEIEIDKAISQIKKQDIANEYWLSSAYLIKALVLEEKGRIDQAKTFYDKILITYENALGDDYASNFLEFLGTASQFFVTVNDISLAKKYAAKAYLYLVKENGESNFQTIKSSLYLLNVLLAEKQYKQVNEIVTKNKSYLFQKIEKAESILDQSKAKSILPFFTFYEAKVKLENEEDISIEVLEEIKNELSKSLKIISTQKNLSISESDSQIAISEYRKVFELQQSVIWKLYRKTNNADYLVKLLLLKEAFSYNKLQKRVKNSMTEKFQSIPEEVLKNEKQLKQRLQNVGIDKESFQTVNQAIKDWDIFLNQIEKDYPKYFQLKYGDFNLDFEQIQNNLPSYRSIVRYQFIEDNLVCVVINKNSINAFDLDTSSIDFRKPQNQQNQLLYQHLWAPIKDSLKREVIIIPDKYLNHISFDALNPTDQLENSVLFGHAISYDFFLSSLSSHNTEKLNNKKDNISVFAPGFSTFSMDTYYNKTKDSLEYDPNYYALIPQPNTLRFAKSLNSRFNGSAYLEENATIQNFKTHQQGKIIHIGTHAESNNSSPSFSKLYFTNTEDTNEYELFAYQIYGLDLGNELTILTACETAKPTFESGEGMVSLSHAFSYAGSKSLLTSLEKIDEESTTEILSFFYDYIEQGKSKNIALQKAKIDYLSSIKGEKKDMQYWAPLILIGEVSPIHLESSNDLILILVGIAALIIIMIFIRRWFNKKSG